jgi:flagellar hook assembly protein FlgD
LLRIIDVNGNVISNLLDSNVEAGRYTLNWDGNSGNGTPAPGGTYFVHLRAGNVEKVKMIILIR